MLLADTPTPKEEIFNQLRRAGEEGAGYSKAGGTTPLSFVTPLLQGFFAILGILFLGLALYGGYLWMTARGDEAQVKKAKSVLEESTIGLIIIVLAYAITTFVLGLFGVG